jgi:hypothetical protein
MRYQGPLAVLLAILVVLGIKTLPSPSTPAEPKREGLLPGTPGKAEPGPGVPASDPTAMSYRQPLIDFLRTGPATTDMPLGEETPWPTILERLRQEHWQLEFLIAAVPDPVDSSSGYRFDSFVDALQRAAETQQYFLDRYFFPWQREGEGTKTDPSPVPQPKGYGVGQKGAANEVRELLRVTPLPREPPQPPRRQREPGVLLFRKVQPGARGPGDRTGKLLVVFLVGETALAGVHKPALTESLNVVAHAKPAHEIRILGPCFSGSQSSLAGTIRSWAEERQLLARLFEPVQLVAAMGVFASTLHVASGRLIDQIRIVSGSATAIERDKLEEECTPACVCFQTTIIPERIVFHALLRHLGLMKSNGPRQPATLTEDVAVLLESNTRYGQSFRTKERKEFDPLSHQYLVYFPFPTHISDVRTSYQQTDDSRKADQVTLPAFESKLRIPLNEGAAAGDTEPSLHPTMTAVTSERVLAETLTAIDHERIRYVAIVASDVKDQIFLATLVRRFCPDVRLLLTSSDVMLSHPDHSYYLKGAIVGSTYPLYPKNQRWSFPFRGGEQRLFHPSQAEQGYYNAAVALLSPSDSTYLLEYGMPFETHDVERPPIWISVIGQSGLQPLTAVLPCTEDDLNQYLADVFEATATGKRLFPEFKPRHTTMWLTPFVVFSAFVFLVLAGYWMARARRGQGREKEDQAKERPWLLPLFGRRTTARQRRSQKYFLFVCLTSILIIYAYAGYVSFIPVASYSVVPLAWWWNPMPWSVLVVLGGFLLLQVLALVSSMLHWGILVIKLDYERLGINLRVLLPRLFLFFAHAGRCFRSARRHPLLVLSVLLVGILPAYLLYHQAYPYWFSEHTSLLFFERATNLPNGISPVVPVFFIGMGIFAWSTFQLKRLYLLDHHRVPFPFPLAKQGPFQEIRKRHLNVWRILVRPESIMASWGAFLVWLILFFTFCRIARRFVPTVEGPWFDCFLLVGLAVYSLLIVHALLQACALWKGLRELLEEIARLPMRLAYDRIPPLVASQFGPYLASERPNRASHEKVQETQRRRMLEAFAGVRPWLPALAPLPEAEVARLEKQVAGTTTYPAPNKQTIEDASVACLALLERFWQRLSVSEALGEPARQNGKSEETNGATSQRATPEGVFLPFGHLGEKNKEAISRWLGGAEDFVVLGVTNYLSQFFVQLRTVVTFLTVGSLLLLFAVLSYPLQPQHLWVFFAGLLVGIVPCVLFWMLIQIERNEVVSRISGTIPNKLNFHWHFIGNLLVYVLPLLATLAAVSTDLSDLIRAWVDPLLHLFR